MVATIPSRMLQMLTCSLKARSARTSTSTIASMAETKRITPVELIRLATLGPLREAQRRQRDRARQPQVQHHARRAARAETTAKR